MSDNHCTEPGCDKPAAYRLNPEIPCDADSLRHTLRECDQAGIPVDADDRAEMIAACENDLDGVRSVRFCIEHSVLFMQNLADEQAADVDEASVRWREEITGAGDPPELEALLLKKVDDLVRDLRSRLPQGMPHPLIRV